METLIWERKSDQVLKRDGDSIVPFTSQERAFLLVYFIIFGIVELQAIIALSRKGRRKVQRKKVQRRKVQRKKVQSPGYESTEYYSTVRRIGSRQALANSKQGVAFLFYFSYFLCISYYWFFVFYFYYFY